MQFFFAFVVADRQWRNKHYCTGVVLLRINVDHALLHGAGRIMAEKLVMHAVPIDMYICGRHAI